MLTLVALSKTHAMLGEFAPALAHAAGAQAIAAETQRPYDVAYASVAPGFAHMMQGAHDDAVAVMEEGLRVARGAGILLLLPSIARYLGRAHAAAGSAEKAHTLLHEALSLTRRRRCRADGLVQRCPGSHPHGWKHSPGQGRAPGALAMATDHGYAPVPAQTLRALGELRLRDGDAVAAEALLVRRRPWPRPWACGQTSLARGNCWPMHCAP